MAKDDDGTKGRAAERNARAGSPDERKARLAAQLRANLRRRKDQARAVRDAPDNEGGG